MLVLTRRVGEKVYVGKNVTVRVLGIRGGSVSLGLAAPASVPIMREEILVAVGRENQRASLVSPERLASLEALFGGGDDGIDG